MACGKPCVVTNSGGINDFVKNENGIISQFEVNSFANCMIEVQENYQYYDSKKIRSICEKLFSEKTIYNKILRHYTYYLSQFTSNHF
jgi:glycosyltransferase involved in cell wall biosynthesis